MLFGHEKERLQGRILCTGCFEQANGGTLFLDEVGEMPMELQAKLLRVHKKNKLLGLEDPLLSRWMLGSWLQRI